MVIGLIAVLAAPPALAERGDGHPRHRFIRPDGPPPAYGGRMDERMEERMRMREFRRRERAADPGAPYFGRLSPEERRQLREDIRSAREGVYRRPPPPPPPLPSLPPITP